MRRSGRHHQGVEAIDDDSPRPRGLYRLRRRPRPRVTRTRRPRRRRTSRRRLAVEHLLDLRRNAEPVHVRETPDVAHEAAASLAAGAPPHPRPSAPVHRGAPAAPRRGVGGDRRTDAAQGARGREAGGTANPCRSLNWRNVRAGATCCDKCDDLTPEAAELQARDHVRRGEAGSDDQQPFGRADLASPPRRMELRSIVAIRRGRELVRQRRRDG